ncbi:MAG: hypothetical protein WA667_19165 [Candidatus Nitrosopolaris sp.]
MKTAYWNPGITTNGNRKINKVIKNRITIVVDWKQSLPPIIAAIIGSGLIVSAFSTISSVIFKPSIEISVKHQFFPSDPFRAIYAITLKNIGYAPATHLSERRF